jgi:exodeoxyribonuclease V alpha subunit
VDSRPDEIVHLDQIVATQLEDLVRENKIVMDISDDGRRYYLRELYWIEQRLGRHVRDLLSTLPAVDVGLPTRPRDGDFVPNDGQWQAIEHALTSRISLITGLPGTGKTTLVKLLLQVIDEADLRLDGEQVRYLLASPTGKAARRLQEATGAQAQTIHRLLQWAPSEGGFLHDEGNPLTARFVIVDEASMVDLKLADALLRAIGPTTHLVLVGDADQLPPVGAGKVFDDLIESACVPSVRLTEIFRQAARSMIVRNAHRIVNGEKPYRNRSEGSVELGVDSARLGWPRVGLSMRSWCSFVSIDERCASRSRADPSGASGASLRARHARARDGTIRRRAEGPRRPSGGRNATGRRRAPRRDRRRAAS